MALFGLPDGSGNSWFGQLFVMFCYGFILFKAAVLIGDGSEKLLLLYGPGIVGGLIIPILGAVPDGAIVLVSGLGSPAVAQCQVATGVGTLAGSTIMLLTIPWALSLFLGCRDMDPATGNAASKANGRPKYVDGFKPFSSCITTYPNTPKGAIIMCFTAISYLIVLIPAIINKSKSNLIQVEEEHYPALVGFIVCAVAFIGYSVFQLYDSNEQTKQKMKQKKLEFLEWKTTTARKIATTGNAISVTFNRFDKDKNGTIDRKELQSGFKSLGLEISRKQVFQIMQDNDADDDKTTLTSEEFTNAFKKWSTVVMSQKKTNRNLFGDATGVDIDVDTDNAPIAVSGGGGVNNTGDIEMKQDQDRTKDNVIIVDQDDDDNDNDKAPLNKKTKQDYQAIKGVDVDDDGFVSESDLVKKMLNDLQVEQDMEEEEEEETYLHLSNARLQFYACIQLLIGTIMVVIFSDPMVSVIGVFSNTIGVSSFFVSFIITPIASNASEIYSSLMFAEKKTQEGVSLGFSALYGAACMNNTFVLCIFCALVFFKELQWTFIAEIIVILITIIVVAINGLKQTIVVWQGFLVILLFPLSLVLVAVLDPLLDDVTPCPSS